MTDARTDAVNRLLAEAKLSLPEAGKLLGTEDEPVHPATVGRWITAGARTPGGRRVRLEAVRIGCRYVTTREAVARFVAALTPSHDAPAPAKAGGKAADRAAAALAAMGA